jgi:predicted DNA-binding transcriptional regulator AlpA
VTDPYVNARQVSDHLQISESTIRKATTTVFNPIPHHRFPNGRSVRYLLAEVTEWMQGTL